VDRRPGARRAIWGFTVDDFTDDDLSAEDHAWLDDLTRESATDFAAAQGYDLRDYVHGGCVAGWWGFTWMILAEARGVLTPEKRAAAWSRHGEKAWGAPSPHFDIVSAEARFKNLHRGGRLPVNLLACRND
jgi:hypothetical protein